MNNFENITITDETYDSFVDNYNEISSIVRFLFLQKEVTKETYNYTNTLLKKYKPENLVNEIISSLCEIDNNHEDKRKHKVERKVGF